MAESTEMPVPRANPKTFVWLKLAILIIAYAAILIGLYTLESKDPTVGGAVTVVAGVIVFFAVIGGVASIFTGRGTRRALAEISQAGTALARGQFAVANEIYTRWCDSKNYVVAALVRHNLGWTLLRQARLDQAIAVLRDNDAAFERALARLSIYATSSVDLALASALAGKLDDASSWLAITDKRAAVTASASLPAMRAFARAVVDCRNGRCDDAARLLDDRWAEYEATLTGSELRPLRVVHAFAQAAAGPRDAGVADALLPASRPIYEGEYDFLGVAWPEMQTFLVTHQLVRTAPPAPPA
jgi:hypothetical protein